MFSVLKVILPSKITAGALANMFVFQAAKGKSREGQKGSHQDESFPLKEFSACILLAKT